MTINELTAVSTASHSRIICWHCSLPLSHQLLW